jgi:hypothetical protein
MVSRSVYYKCLLVESPMTVIFHHLTAKCTPEALWDILSDLGRVAEYNPAVAEAQIVGSILHGTGATRACNLRPKGRVTERVTVWEEGRKLGFEVVESDWPLRSMNWVTSLDSTPGGCRVDQRLEYRAKYGPFGWVMDRLMMRRMIERSVGAALSEMIALAEGRA